MGRQESVHVGDRDPVQSVERDPVHPGDKDHVYNSSIQNPSWSTLVGLKSGVYLLSVPDRGLGGDERKVWGSLVEDPTNSVLRTSWTG